MKKLELCMALLGALLFSGCTQTVQPQAKVVDLQFYLSSQVLLTENGEVYTWGENSSFGTLGQECGQQEIVPEPQQISFPSPIAEIAPCADSQNLIFVRDVTGQYYAWGNNRSGIILGAEATIVTTPVKVDLGIPVKDLDHSARMLTVQTPDGDFYGCGIDPTFAESYFFTDEEERAASSAKLEKIEIPSESPIIDFQTMYQYRTFLNESGEVFVQGTINGIQGEFPDATHISYPEKIVQIAPMYRGLVTLGESGSLYFMGYDSFGICTEDRNQVVNYISLDYPDPVPIAKMKDPVQTVWAGLDSIIVETRDGEYYTWGYNISCNNGEQKQEFVTIPNRLDLPGKAVQFSVGPFNSAAWMENGDVWIWGSNWGRAFSPDEKEATFTPQLAFSPQNPDRGFELPE